MQTWKAEAEHGRQLGQLLKSIFNLLMMLALLHMAVTRQGHTSL